MHQYHGYQRYHHYQCHHNCHYNIATAIVIVIAIVYNRELCLASQPLGLTIAITFPITIVVAIKI